MNNTVFTHRPKVGVSVGATNANDKLYVAIAIANNGYSFNGNFNKERCDAFSRKRARQILEGRLAGAVESASKGEPLKSFVIEVNTHLTARDFMKEFRKVFKPDVDENDGVFGAFVRSPFPRSSVVFERDDACDIIFKITSFVFGIHTATEVPF